MKCKHCGRTFENVGRLAQHAVECWPIEPVVKFVNFPATHQLISQLVPDRKDGRDPK